MGPAALAQVLAPLKGFWSGYDNPNLLVGLDVADDAAVYRLSDEQVLIQTVDFFTPIVDDPRVYGGIAAANALSDIYAMGGELLFALNIGGFPGHLPTAMISEIFLGAAEKVREAGGIIVGGHTVTDEEPKFGLVATGTAHPKQILTLAGAQPGDSLIFTKPLGNGIIATAGRANGLTDPTHLENAIAWMLTLNRNSAKALRQVSAHACTDVTGFGFLGHTTEMAEASHVSITIRADALPLLEGARAYAAAGYTTGGAGRNARFFHHSHIDDAVPDDLKHVLWDPQTSGGLLIAIACDQRDTLLNALTVEGVIGYVVGEVTSAGEGIVTVLP